MREANTTEPGETVRKAGTQSRNTARQRHGSGQPGAGNDGGQGQSGSKPAHARTLGARSRSRTSRSQGIASSINQARRNQMLSHVANKLHDELDKESNPQAQAARRKLGEQGELEVVDDLRAKGYEVTRMPARNEGYDLEAVNPATSEILYIEVKGDSFDWSDKGVSISSPQYHFGFKKGTSF